MGWIYLAELEDSQSHSVNGCDQSPIAKSTPIVKESSYLDNPMEAFSRLQYGMIYGPSQVVFSKEELLTSLQPAFHARISVLQDLEKAWQESGADFFSRSCAWPKKSSPNFYFLKTSLQLQPEEEFRLLQKLPKWGSMRGGVVYPLLPLERCIEEKDGFYWPTPQARAQSDTPSERARHSPCLHTVVLMATPTASQANKPIRSPSPTRQNGTHGEDLQDSIGRLNPESIGKRLCPRWVSVLMGYPTTWTDLEPWAIAWFLSKQKKRSKS